ncbi:MAG TPA: hypothetical protein VK150_00265, partial [Geothrix sp.]|nr:hypothetical protein [Geothrix sp.]
AQGDKLGREIGAEAERRRQEAVLTYGGNTGQAARAQDAFGNAALMRQAEFGRDVAAGRAQAAEQARAGAVQQGTALLGQDQQAAAQLATLGIQQQEGAADRTSREALAREGYQVQQQEGAAERAAREKLATAEIGSRERMQYADQTFQAAQSDLNRSLEQLLSNDRIGAQFKMAEMDQAFQERIQANGFVQDKDLEAMRADLQKSLQERGIQADTAKQIADQKFTAMQAEKDQAFQTQMEGMRQKFVTGERIGSQEWEGSMKTLDMRHEELLSKWEIASREGMQTKELETQIKENAKARASQEMMAAATLAMTDKNFQAELQQRYQFNDQDIKLKTKELEGQLNLMGLQGEQLKGAIADQKVSSAMNIAALGMEIGDGSEEAMKPFAEQFGAAIEEYMKSQGITISSDDIEKSLMTGANKGKTTAPTRTDTGSFGDGSTVAGVDLKSITREDWKAVSSDPAKLSQFVKAGAVKEISSLGSITRIGDATKTIADAGLNDRVATTAGDKITFKPQTYVYYNGKPYELSFYESGLEGTGSFSDKSRNGYLHGIDLTTGKEVVIKHDRKDI